MIGEVSRKRCDIAIFALAVAKKLPHRDLLTQEILRISEQCLGRSTVR